jgi:hypothetical protein
MTSTKTQNIKRISTALFLIMAAAILFSSASPRLNLHAADEPTWGPLQFLTGTWGAAESGKPEASAYSFLPELKGHVLVRRCVSGCDQGPMGAGYSDILYLYSAAPGQPYRAIFFDSVGHVLQYDVSSPSPNKAVFLSDASAPGPRFRLTYELAAGKMLGTFEMLPPGGAPAQVLSSWSGAKK